MTVIIRETENWIIVAKLQAARVPHVVKRWRKPKATIATAKRWAARRGYSVLQEAK